MYWLYLFFGINGQGVYTTWTIIASLINLSHCLVYVSEIEMETVSSIALGALLGIVIIYSVLESTILNTYLRFMFTPYLTIIYASIGILDKIKTKDGIPQSTENLTKAIIGTTCVILIFKIGLVIFRQHKKPLDSFKPARILI